MLARIRKAMAEKEEGFTLIELLVVMIIIGILAAIAIPVFLSQKQKGYDASLKSDLRTIANELESYNTDGNGYPTNVAITGIGNPVVVGTTRFVRRPATRSRLRTTRDRDRVLHRRATNTEGHPRLGVRLRPRRPPACQHRHGQRAATSCTVPTGVTF